jgi:hypothetical protein
MRRRFACLFVILAVGCSAKPPEQEKARQALTAQAGEVRRAMLEADHDRMADLTHAAVVNGLGGKARFKEQLAAAMEKMRGQGFSIKEIILAEPSDLVAAGGRVYAVVPFDMDMTGPGGAVYDKPSYLIGESADGGATWTFIDGEGVRGDRTKLRQLLPDCPDALPLPPPQGVRRKG